MAIYDLPSDILIHDVTISHSTPQFITTSLNLKQRASDRGLHQLQGSFSVKVIGERDKRKFESWLVKMKGRLNQFNLNLGGRFSIDSSRLSNPTLSAAVGIGATQIPLNAFAGDIWEGDYINFPNDMKTYMAITDLSGSGVITISPALRQAQPDNASLSMQDVTIHATLIDDLQTLTYSESGIVTEFQCSWKEYL